jgi:hypothetical protein
MGGSWLRPVQAKAQTLSKKQTKSKKNWGHVSSGRALAKQV